MNRETQFMGRLGAPVRKYNACSQFNMGYLVELRRVRPVKGDAALAGGWMLLSAGLATILLSILHLLRSSWSMTQTVTQTVRGADGSIGAGDDSKESHVQGRRAQKGEKVRRRIDPGAGRTVFPLLSACPLDFRCILQLLITTGIRR